MTIPGPKPLGRSVVVSPGADTPPPWQGCERLRVSDALLGDAAALADTVDRLHRAWVGRRPVVVELEVSDRDLATPEVEQRTPWELGPGFTFLRERLHFLVWANAYDARRDPAVWWWGRKAERLGVATGTAADVVLADGTEAWIDGGPRGPIVGIRRPVIHAESILAGRVWPRPAEPPAPGGLAPDQAAAVLHGAGPARIIAPAGSGKTRTLIARIRHLLATVEPDLVWALAYNSRAATEMRERLGDRRVSVRTLHSLGWEILRDARPDVQLLEEREVRRRLEGLVAVPRRPNTDVVGPYLEALGEVRVALRSPEQVAAGRDDVPEFARVYRRYRERLRTRGEADFDEQVFGAIEALLTDPELRRRWQGRCRHLLVDEFQDLTPAYLLLVRLVASPELDVFGVGDDDQTIYGYAGADPTYLIDFDRFFPGAATHHLDVNYRCPVPVVEASSRLLAHNRRRVDKQVRPAPDAATDPESLQVTRVPAGEVAAATGAAVAAAVAEAGTAGTAVLSRVNSALLPVQAALVDGGIAFRSPLGPDLARRTVMAAALAWLRLADRPDAMSRADLLAAVRRPSRGLNRVAADLLASRRRWDLAELRRLASELTARQADRWTRFCDDLAALATRRAHGDVGDLLGLLVDQVGLGGAARALDGGRTRADRAAQSDDLVALRRAAALHPEPSDFEEWLLAVLGAPRDPDGVTLSTVHRVKGMEWDRVIVFGADRGLLPHALATDVEEERRVFHVALTRSRRAVTVIAEAGTESRFVAEMLGREPVVVDEPVAIRLRPVGPRAVPGATPPVDEALLERLRAWRTATARARGLPAYVVMHDRTLEAIAATRPGSEAELLSVPGIGPAKLEAYGDDLLAICADES